MEISKVNSMPTLTFKIQDHEVKHYSKVSDFKKEVYDEIGFTATSLFPLMLAYITCILDEEDKKIEYLRVGKVRII